MLNGGFLILTEMGELKSSRLDEKREIELTPKRMKYALDKLSDLGYNITQSPCGKKLTFDRKPGKTVVLFVYSGWWSGKGIGSGRGIDKLIKTLGYE